MSSSGVCPSVRPSVTFVDHVKTNKHILEFFSPSGSHAKRYGDISTNPPPDGNVEYAGGVGKKRDSVRISGFAAYRSTVLSTVRVANCEKQSRDGRRRAWSRALTAASVVRTRRRRSVCDGLDVMRRRGQPLGHNPLGHNPRFLLP